MWNGAFESLQVKQLIKNFFPDPTPIPFATVSLLRTIHDILRKWHLLVYQRVWKRDNTSDNFLTSKSSERKENFRKVILKIFWEQQRAIKNNGKKFLFKKSMLRSKKFSIWIYGVFSCWIFSWADTSILGRMGGENEWVKLISLSS